MYQNSEKLHLSLRSAIVLIMLTLKVEKRTDNGVSAAALRRGGSVLGVVYGAGDS